MKINITDLNMNKNKLLKIFSLALCISFVITGVRLFVKVPENNSQDENPEPIRDSEFSECVVEGVGTYFEITNSTYLNITLTSSEPIYIRLEVVPKMVSLVIKPNNIATSTLLTLTGFELNTEYYLYQDGNLMEEFKLDATGRFSYLQDISKNHHIYTQEEKSTIYINEDGSVTADASDNQYLQKILLNKILIEDVFINYYYLIGDIKSNIVINRDNTIFDGNGYKLMASTVEMGLPSSTYGIYLNGRSRVTIKNLKVSYFDVGIKIFDSIQIEIINNDFFYCRFHPISLDLSNYNTFSGNTFVESYLGFQIVDSDYNTISHNIAERNGIGFSLVSGSDSNTFSHNIANYNYQVGFYLGVTSNNILTGNVGNHNGNYGFYLIACSSNILTDNIANYNSLDGIQLYSSYLGASSSNILTDNIANYNSQDGIHLYSSPNNFLTGNVANFNSYNGIRLRYSSSDNTLIGNIANYNNDKGFYLLDSSNNILSENVGNHNGDYGFYLSLSSNDNTLTDNAATYNNHGFFLDGSDNNMISKNDITENNECGFFLYHSKANTLTANIVSNNGQYGFRLEQGSDGNLIYHNKIYKNVIQAYDDTPSENDWHHPDLLEGNHWSDYPGFDDGSGVDKHAIAGDGIGDTDIPWPDTEYDFYPLVSKSRCLLWVNKVITEKLVLEDSCIRVYGDLEIAETGELHLINCTVRVNNGTNPVEYGIKVYGSMYVSEDTKFTAFNPVNPYFFVIHEDALLSMNDSRVEFCGSDTAPYNYLRALTLWSTDNCWIENNVFANCSTGLFILVCKNTTILNNILVNNTDSGISIIGSDNTLIQGNTIKNNEFVGIGISSGWFNDIIGNTVNDNYYGIFASNCHNTTISNNIMINNTYTAIRFEQAKSCTVSNNIAIDTAGVAIASFYTIINQECEFINNTVIYPQGSGFAIWYSDDNSYINNTVYHDNYGFNVHQSSGTYLIGNIAIGGGEGFSLFESPDTYLINNVVVNASTYGFKVRTDSNNSSLIKNQVINCLYGIYVSEVENVKLINNTVINVEHPNAYGIRIYNSIYLDIYGNLAEDYNTGFLIYNVHNSTFENNYAINNSYYGIRISICSDNVITHNIVDGSIYGFYLWRAENNTITLNNITNNEYGLYFDNPIGDSFDNVIYHNNFINNIIQAYDDLPTSSYWYNPDTNEGNYWSDYSGVDDGSGTGVAGDGIGDTDLPWYYDPYPFINENGWL